MSSHYRRLNSAELDALAGATEYEKLATFAAVHVADHEGGVIAHVAAQASESLPGRFEAESIEAMDPGVRAHVLHARWIPVGANDPGYGPVSQIPVGAEVLETGINPHSFAIGD